MPEPAGWSGDDTIAAADLSAAVRSAPNPLFRPRAPVSGAAAPFRIGMVSLAAVFA